MAKKRRYSQLFGGGVTELFLKGWIVANGRSEISRVRIGAMLVMELHVSGASSM